MTSSYLTGETWRRLLTKKSGSCSTIRLCHAGGVTQLDYPSAAGAGAMLVLGIDTCGPSGSVALGRLETYGGVEVLGKIELEGRSYSATLVAAIRDLLARAGARVADLGCVVAVNGPGSFTGVRVGLSAVKGLAEPAQIPVVAVSRLAVLASKAGTPSAALDAHRHEIFLRLAVAGREPRELLAGAHELAALDVPAAPIAVCDDAAAPLLNSAWPDVELARTPAPTASDAVSLCAPRIAAKDFIDLALLDGHYLRRSDAEIFGETAAAAAHRP
jgi:tRNA threonylcarbamoyladenosine biosynthesis protein TsaB